MRVSKNRDSRQNTPEKFLISPSYKTAVKKNVKRVCIILKLAI